MSSPASAPAGGVLLVTQVYPPQFQSTPQQGTQTFIRADLLALGTVQIMIGAMVCLFGIVTAIPGEYSRTSLMPLTGFFVWGAAFYITSGSLTVAAGKSTSRCLVKTCLGFNVVAFVAAVMAIITYALDATGMFLRCYYNNHRDCDLYKTRIQGFAGVLTVFHALEFVVSITVTALVCRTTCNHDNQQQQIYVMPGNASLAAHAPPIGLSCVPPVYLAHPPQQVVSFPKPEDHINPGLAEPPAYTEMRAEHL